MTVHAPQLTLVTVCYQDLENVKRTCQSIADQQGELLAGYEHLLVDGASTDGTKEPLWPARDDVRVLYGVGGVLDTDVYRQLKRRHDARVNAYNVVGLLAWWDESWMGGQVGYIRVKKFSKRTLSKLDVKRLFGRIVS